MNRSIHPSLPPSWGYTKVIPNQLRDTIFSVCAGPPPTWIRLKCLIYEMSRRHPCQTGTFPFVEAQQSPSQITELLTQSPRESPLEEIHLNCLHPRCHFLLTTQRYTINSFVLSVWTPIHLLISHSIVPSLVNKTLWCSST